MTKAQVHQFIRNNPIAQLNRMETAEEKIAACRAVIARLEIDRFQSKKKNRVYSETIRSFYDYIADIEETGKISLHTP